MAASPSPLNSPAPGNASPGQTGQQSGSGASPSPSDMAGMGGGDDAQSAPQGNSSQQAMGQIVETIRGMESGLMSLSKAFPAATPDIRRAVDAVRMVLKRIVSNPGAQDTPAPGSMA